MILERMDAYFADFGEPVVLAGEQTRAIVDAAYLEPLGERVASRQMQLTIADDWLAATGAVRGSPAVVRAANYRVAEVQPDGTGHSVVLLEKVT